jgi:hypothetical protein
MSQRLDLKGKRFGRLIVLAFAGVDRSQSTLWECECSCGNVSVVRGIRLTSGRLTACPECTQKALVGHRKAFSRSLGPLRPLVSSHQPKTAPVEELKEIRKLFDATVQDEKPEPTEAELQYWRSRMKKVRKP